MKRKVFLSIGAVAAAAAVLAFIFLALSKPAPNAEQAIAPVEAGRDTPPVVENTPIYMHNPEITITNTHRFEKGEAYSEWVGETFNVSGNSIKIPGYGFIITVKFNNRLDTDAIHDNLFVSGPGESSIDTGQNPTISLRYPKVSPGDTYTLSILKGLKDVDGNILAEDIQVEITCEADALANYTLPSEEYDYSLEDYRFIEYVNITDSPKRIIIDFTGDVDKNSVEESIRKSLSYDNVKCDMNWLEDRTLQLDISNFPKDKDFVVSMEGAVDSNGFKILGDLRLLSGEPNSIGFIDLGTKKASIIRNFEDKRYMALHNNSIGRYIVLDDSAVRYVFDIEENSIIKKFNGGSVWLDEDRTLLEDYENKKILIHSLKDGSKKAVWDLSFIPEQQSIRMFSISPDKTMVAVTCSIMDQGYGGPESLYIFSLDGKLLYEYKNIVNVKPIRFSGEISDIAWLDNSNIVMESSEEIEGCKIDLVKVNIETGKKELLFEDASGPITLPYRDMILALRHGKGIDPGYTILKEGSEIAEINLNSDKYPGGCTLRNFFFIDDMRLVYNRNDEIVLFNMKSMEEEVIGRGYVIGLSKEGSRAYFITNYKDLHVYY